MEQQQINMWLALQGRLTGGDLLLPEYRELEMYTSKRRHDGGESVLDGLSPSPDPALLSQLLPSWITLHLLESSFEVTAATPLEGVTSWQRYLALPRRSLAEKIVAESYRLLRIVRVALQHPQGVLKGNGQRIELGCHANVYPLQLVISSVGLRLLDSLIHVYLRSRDCRELGPAYLDAMLLSYYTDLVAELRGFEDEDRALCQFRPVIEFNRHWRLECRNARYRVEHGYCLLQLAPRYADGQCHPIDFYVQLNDHHYRVPMEALVVPPSPQHLAVDGQPLRCAIAMSELAGWQIGKAPTRSDGASADVIPLTR